MCIRRKVLPPFMLDNSNKFHYKNQQQKSDIKIHGSESQGQGGSTLRQPLDERT